MMERTDTAEALNVLQVVPSFDPSFGGPVSSAYSVALAYQEFGVEVRSVGLGVPEAHWDRDESIGFNGWQLSSSKRHVATVSFSLLWWLWRNVRRYDYIHVHYSRGLALIFVPLIARARSVPYVIQTHGMCEPWQGVPRLVDELLTWPALRAASRVLVLNAHEAESLQRRANLSNCEVLYNSVAEVSGVDDRAGDHSRKLLFCSRLHPRKGLATFLTVAQRVQAIDSSVEVHVVGADEGALSMARESALRLELSVHFHGGLDRKQVRREMLGSTVLLHPAPREPFGLSMIEAMSLGLPVVASGSSALSDVFLEYGAALLVGDGDYDVWTESTLDVLYRPEVRDILVEGGRRLVRDQFSISSLSAKLKELALNVVGQR